jgi:hypothetical protein
MSQLKLTSSSGQFIRLYNQSDATLDLSGYQLEYFNNYDLAKATSSKLISLPGSLSPHSYYLVNDDSLLLCYQQTVDSQSLGLSTTAGLVEVLGATQTAPGKAVAPQILDYVAWSKTAAGGVQTLPTSTAASLLRQGNVDSPGTGTWQAVQPSLDNPCQLVSAANQIVPGGPDDLLPPAVAPATIVSLAGTTSTGPSLPDADHGLQSPSVTELLPNPNGTGTDGTDEFIELYNPNISAFDLTGFSLVSGKTTLRHYIFAAGTSLPPRSFTAFYSSVTGLNMSNSGGQVQLVDPFGQSISATALYGAAKDGQTWALANGKWYWTEQPTPGAANVVKQAVTTAKPAKTPTVKGPVAKTAPVAQVASTSDASSATSPIHAGTLALVGGLALLYGAYEYRHDLANRLHQLRRHRRARRQDRPAT